jgi:hypothetical protein
VKITPEVPVAVEDMASLDDVIALILSLLDCPTSYLRAGASGFSRLLSFLLLLLMSIATIYSPCTHHSLK